jgi:ATP-dependent exoDNAse (exonuclease V) beta subunit
MSAVRELTEQQRDAVERRRGPLALSAAAGSGKTSVLVERYVAAVTEDGIAPGRILAITFTDRAAGELRERVRRSLVAAGERDAARESAAAFISTFHGFCARVLRSHAVLAGLSPDFVVLNDTQALALREAAFERAVTGWLEERPEALELASLFSVAGLRSAVGEVYDELRSRGERSPVLPVPVPRHDGEAAAGALARALGALRAELAAREPSKGSERALERLERCAAVLDGPAVPPPFAFEGVALGNGSRALSSPACAAYEAARAAYAEACADRLGAPAVAALDALVRTFGARYDAQKRARGAVDFDDLELIAGELLGAHHEIAALWSQRFELLMVDELQDTNARQMAILAALERDNLFTVGDEFQSIYGFRHADVGLFRDRRERLERAGAASVLSTNFRSRPPLLAAVNEVFAGLFGEHFVALVAGRSAPVAPTGGAVEPSIELLVCDSDGWEEHEERLGVELAPAPLWRRAEARLLAARIAELVASGAARAEDIVVLFRSGGSIPTYEAALADVGLATLATTGGGFFARPEVVDLTAYVRALANPLDELALYGVLASPLCGCSSDQLASLALRARESGQGAWAALVAAPPDARAAAFAQRFAEARDAAGDRGLAELIADAVAASDYDLHLAALHSPQRRIANVHKLERLAREFELREGRDLRRFAQALEQGRIGSLRETEAPPPAEGTGAIALMTIHSAKGLEFPVVCLADLGRRPNDADLPALLTDGARVGLRLPTLEHRGIETLAYAELRARRAAAAAAEEQRVIYVALTRARERLILSGAARLESWPAEGSTALAWLGPALVPDLPARAAAGAGVVAETVAGAGGVNVALTLLRAQFAPGLLWADEARSPDAGSGGAGAGGAAPGGAGSGEAGSGATGSGDAGSGGAGSGGFGEQPELPFGPGAPDPVTAPPAGTLSYSALAEYERCAYRYHLQRVIGLPDAPDAGGGGEGAAARGVVVHALLERLDFSAPRVPGSSEVAAAAAAAGVTLDPREDLAVLGELAGAFARSPLCARLAAAHELRREEAFAFVAPGGELLRGFLDVVAREADGSLLVVDFKSDRLADGADPAALVARDYSLQRLVYALAALATGAPAVEVAHCYLRSPELVAAVRYLAAEREALEGELQARLRPLREGRFAVSPDPDRGRCGGCPGRARLCSYAEEMTSRDPPGALF